MTKPAEKAPEVQLFVIRIAGNGRIDEIVENK